MSGVCYQCEDRKVYWISAEDHYNCHNHCQKYAEEIQKRREEKEKYEKGRSAYRLQYEYDVDKRIKLSKKYMSKRG